LVEPVPLCCSSPDELAELRFDLERAGGQAAAFPADLADLDDIDRMVTEVLERHGGVDILVNNAGRSIRRSVALSYDRFHDFERTMQLNYFGAVRLILGLLPAMSAQRSGHIVNVSSAGVQAGAPRFAGYIASKAALDAFSESVQAEMHADGVRFTTVYTPLVRTPMTAPTKIYERLPAISAAQAAQLLCDAITYRPRRVGTLFGTAAAVGTAVAPWSMDAVRGFAYQLFPDSHAAKGESGDDEDTSGLLGTVFGRLFPGVHW
jgi:NAD(P)-dependent dehydrogenase (short-subunit alcohol dehydrogenase family)